VAEREVRSISYQIEAARFPVYKDLAGFNFAASDKYVICARLGTNSAGIIRSSTIALTKSANLEQRIIHNDFIRETIRYNTVKSYNYNGEKHRLSRCSGRGCNSASGS